MSHPTQSPGTAVPGPAAPASAPAAPASPPAPAAPNPDVSRQIADLTDAVNRLVQAQQQQQQQRPARTDAPVPPPAPDVGGDIPGGEPLVPAVDYARLSPLQQITLGLRDAKSVGPAHPTVLHGARRASAPANNGGDDAPPAGAD